ncbi:MAG: hypothetical protein CMH52_06345 [Myxococcales bacterium]|nr:hypothetical protein [Myxococcales bacterium]|tara:strand:+ start:2181 stop:2504 length:324 start_codon:yes stop_codon:yes gene_type:complete
MRDWKDISKTASQSHPGGVVMLESPHFPVEGLPEGSVRFYHPDMSMEVEGPEISPKEIRKFLWSNRMSRPVTRDRAFVETFYNEEDDISSLKVGTITADAVIERIKS